MRWISNTEAIYGIFLAKRIEHDRIKSNMCFYKTGSCWCILVRHCRMSDIGEQCNYLWSDLTIVSKIWYHINIQDHRIEVCNKDIDWMYVAFLGSALHHQSCCSPTWISLLPTIQSIFHRRKQSYSYHLIHMYTMDYVLTIVSYLNFTCPVVTSEVLRAKPVIKSNREKTLWILVLLVKPPGSAKNTSVMSILMNNWNSTGRSSKLATTSDSSGLSKALR